MFYCYILHTWCTTFFTGRKERLAAIFIFILQALHNTRGGPEGSAIHGGSDDCYGPSGTKVHTWNLLRESQDQHFTHEEGSEGKQPCPQYLHVYRVVPCTGAMAGFWAAREVAHAYLVMRWLHRSFSFPSQVIETMNRASSFLKWSVCCELMGFNLT